MARRIRRKGVVRGQVTIVAEELKVLDDVDLHDDVQAVHQDAAQHEAEDEAPREAGEAARQAPQARPTAAARVPAAGRRLRVLRVRVGQERAGVTHWVLVASGDGVDGVRSRAGHARG